VKLSLCIGLSSLVQESPTDSRRRFHWRASVGAGRLVAPASLRSMQVLAHCRKPSRPYNRGPCPEMNRQFVARQAKFPEKTKDLPLRMWIHFAPRKSAFKEKP
jgi:hypothetical protein